MSAKKQKGREVPAIVVVVTYLICWAVGGFLAYTAHSGDTARLVGAAFFILFPISGTSPLELIRAWRG